MGTNTEHIFAGAMTIDGSPVNAIRTYDNRKISQLVNKRTKNGSYVRVSEEKLNPNWHNCIVYVWDETECYPY